MSLKWKDFSELYINLRIFIVYTRTKNPPQIISEQLKVLLPASIMYSFPQSKVKTVQYEGFSRLQAVINCMADLLQKPVQWKYVLNLCGQDFPLKTNLEIVQQLKMYKGLNAISGEPTPSRFSDRTLYHYEVKRGKLRRTMC
ncbi:Beta-1,3-galactosyl-O-glycosyl-glycoprotein beta-1,6-N-acetylglucosaminyltransferase 3 [Holothuria leucospilota]|uniref:Beta-1,3-galactosyl-O-glycosyl-glycoprotein beta-1,6-N-acetylglucosaminyltransferase 3 n=1 Tax=Holothuria leucospilota TaxID=206669 RepID=A0A9Q1C0P1_HOLLE|nr:Beta-1,3-galactosyl-O-glycosyl-glycoprotein beta-1,6-N-acetylglucosaminyltransferase 3 [Holothuria leucospilota]